MDPIPSSSGSLDVALSNAHNKSPRWRTFRPSTHQTWPGDRKLTQSFGCLRWFLGLHTDVENPLADANRTCSYTSLYRENVQQKYRNRISECSLSPLSARVSAIIEVMETRTQRPLFKARENRQSTYNLSFLQSYAQFYVLLDVTRGWRSLGY